MGYGKSRPEMRPSLEVLSTPVVRTINPRQKIAMDSNAGQWITIGKPASETRSSTAVLANDGHLLFTVAANTKYRIRAEIFFDTNGTPDFKWIIAGPAAATLYRMRREWIVPGVAAWTAVDVHTSYGAGEAIAGAGSTGGLLSLSGVLHNGVNPGSFAFQWAQNTSDAAATTVLAGSYIEYMVV
jgi:hypothetical protein